MSVLAGGLVVAQIPPAKDRSYSKLPGIVLWAWERPENLEFIDPSRVAVAYLARSIELSGDEVTVHPRLQPLNIPPATTLIAVVRISTRGKPASSYSADQCAITAAHIIRCCSVPGIRALQIDF